MSILVTPANSKATAQAKDKRDALTLALVLVVICLGNLALLWQIFSDVGFPNQFFCDSWVVGFWRADHG